MPTKMGMLNKMVNSADGYSGKGVIVTDKLAKTYSMGKEKLTVLQDISLVVEKNEYVAIMGPSGSGKSTLLNILGCLDIPSSGTYSINGQNTSVLNASQLAQLRNIEIGFVFQNFNLLPKLTIWANVELPLIYGNVPVKERKERVSAILNHFGLWERRKHKPSEISGGQKQRVAIARALVKKPAILLADEPTGNLDSKTTQDIMGIFNRLINDGNTILLITHEREVAEHASRVLNLIDGKIIP